MGGKLKSRTNPKIVCDLQGRPLCSVISCSQWKQPVWWRIQYSHCLSVYLIIFQVKYVITRFPRLMSPRGCNVFVSFHTAAVYFGLCVCVCVKEGGGGVHRDNLATVQRLSVWIISSYFCRAMLDKNHHCVLHYRRMIYQVEERFYYTRCRITLLQCYSVVAADVYRQRCGDSRSVIQLMYNGWILILKETVLRHQSTILKMARSYQIISKNKTCFCCAFL